MHIQIQFFMNGVIKVKIDLNEMIHQLTNRYSKMGASYGKSKKELKEEAKEWAKTKENEVAELYAQNAQLRNQIIMMQVDIQALRDMLKGQQFAVNESVKQIEERMTEMENDVKVIPFEWNPCFKTLAMVVGDEPMPNAAYLRKQIINGSLGPSLTTVNIAFGVRVMSLSQYEKIYKERDQYENSTLDHVTSIINSSEYPQQLKVEKRNYL